MVGLDPTTQTSNLGLHWMAAILGSSPRTGLRATMERIEE